MVKIPGNLTLIPVALLIGCGPSNAEKLYGDYRECFSATLYMEGFYEILGDANKVESANTVNNEVLIQAIVAGRAIGMSREEVIENLFAEHKRIMERETKKSNNDLGAYIENQNKRFSDCKKLFE